MLAWTYYVLLLLTLVVGWLLNILGLPGLWLMLLAHVLFSWATGWGHYAGWPAFFVLLGLVLAAEAIEFAAGAAGSKAAGGSKRGMAGAVAGGFAGALAGSVFIPVPILGTIVGAVAGSFLGAAVTEKLVHPNTRRALRIGYGAAKGRLIGIVSKSLIGLVMAAVSLATALPLGRPAPSRMAATLPAGLGPTTSPATVPATTRP